MWRRNARHAPQIVFGASASAPVRTKLFSSTDRAAVDVITDG
jgi:hypothetical protein